MGVLRSAPRAEAITGRLEVRLEDRLQDQLQGGLHDPVPGGRDAEAAALAARLGDHPFPDREGLEPLGLEVVSKPGEQQIPE